VEAATAPARRLPEPPLPGAAQPALPKPRPKWLEALNTLREILALGGRSIACLVTPPFVWKGEFVEQGWSLAKKAWFPLALSALAFGYGAPGVQGATFTTSVGSVERVGIIASNATVREVAVWVTGMLVSGVAGTAICADLGARKIRQELDAMAVMGVDVVRRMIAPRVLALTLLMPALGMIAIVGCMLGNLLAALQFGSTVGGFWQVVTHTLTVIDTQAFLIKTALFGFVVSVVCCYMGMNAKGGSQGVGRAVNQAVVIAFVAVWVINYAFNSTYQAAFPEIQGLR
jgi:phospholipid/cholesterol/gamma-HCH transport system permease protein